MKRSDFFIRLTTAVLFLAVASYIGVYIYNAVINTYETTMAVSYAIEETYPANGYIIRTETVIRDTGDTVMPVVSEGEKVASGQIVAVEYLSREALETAGEIRALRLRIAMLESSGGAAENARLDSVMALSAAVNRGNFTRLDELSLNIETYVFEKETEPETELPVLQAQLEMLERMSTGVRMIHAPVSGVFSHVVDGYEHIEPRALTELLPDELAEMFKTQYRASGAGKLVTEFKWYYAAVMSDEDAMRLQAGTQVMVHFSGVYNMGMQMRIESIGRRDAGQCVVVFSSDRSVHDIAQLRDLRAEVVFDVVSGIRVPREAIHLDNDGTTFIYLQTGVRAERVNVDILQEFGDSYLVRDGVDTGTPLRVGSLIIVKANNLYHGKIVA